MFSLAGQLVFDGFAMGLVFVILAGGLVLILSVSKILFMAYGMFYTIGAYATWYAVNHFELPYFISLFVGVSVAGSIGWAMELYEKGILNKQDTFGLELTWGNPESILNLIEQIAGKEGFGRILADGTHKAAEKLGKGEDSLIQVKGMDLIMADPRGLKGFGLGYAVASRGGDHLRSEPFIELSDDPSIGERMFGDPGATLRRSDHGKGKLVSYFEDWCAVVDSLEPCKNVAENMELLPFDRASEIMRIVTGIEFSPEDMRNAGARIVTIERMFGVREGITRDNDTLPSRFTQPLTEGNSRGQIVNLDLMLDEYYDERGWDKKTGIPTQSTLKKLGLSFASTT